MSIHSPKTYLKAVAIGDGGCGKTCLFTVFAHGEFPHDYIPTTFESWVVDFDVMGKKVRVALWDTAGQEEYDCLRPQSYPDADMIFICFSVVRPESFQNTLDKWIVEAKKYANTVPIYLVGCKVDLRDDQDSENSIKTPEADVITTKQGKIMASKIKAKKYLECSALTGEGVQAVFREAAEDVMRSRDRSQLKKKTKKKTKCAIL